MCLCDISGGSCSCKINPIILQFCWSIKKIVGKFLFFCNSLYIHLMSQTRLVGSDLEMLWPNMDLLMILNLIGFMELLKHVFLSFSSR